MQLKVSKRINGDCAEIIIEGDFNGVGPRDFREAFDSVFEECRRVIIDLREACTIDSIALGLLVEARSKVPPDTITLKVTRGSTAAESLAQVNFDSLFNIEAE